jgi:hypothetical protein
VIGTAVNVAPLPGVVMVAAWVGGGEEILPSSPTEPFFGPGGGITAETIPTDVARLSPTVKIVIASFFILFGLINLSITVLVKKLS